MKRIKLEKLFTLGIIFLLITSIFLTFHGYGVFFNNVRALTKEKLQEIMQITTLDIEQAIDNGIKWLANKQEQDGGWPAGGYGSSRLYNTWQSMLAFRSTQRDVKYSSLISKALDYIENQEADPFVIQLLILFGFPVSDSKIQNGINQILKTQNQDGSWGKNDNGELTAHNVWALSLAGYSLNSDPIKKAIDYIFYKQGKDGSWIWTWTGRGDSGVTGRIITYLLLSGVSASDTRVQKAVNYIKSKQANNGGWQSSDGYFYIGTTTKALCALALSGENFNSEYIQKALKFLLTYRNPDGSFHNWVGNSSSEIYVTGDVIFTLGIVMYGPIKQVKREVLYLNSNLNHMQILGVYTEEDFPLWVWVGTHSKGHFRLNVYLPPEIKNGDLSRELWLENMDSSIQTFSLTGNVGLSSKQVALKYELVDLDRKINETLGSSLTIIGKGLKGLHVFLLELITSGLELGELGTFPTIFHSLYPDAYSLSLITTDLVKSKGWDKIDDKYQRAKEIISYIQENLIYKLNEAPIVDISRDLGPNHKYKGIEKINTLFGGLAMRAGLDIRFVVGLLDRYEPKWLYYTWTEVKIGDEWVHADPLLGILGNEIYQGKLWSQLFWEPLIPLNSRADPALGVWVKGQWKHTNMEKTVYEVHPFTLGVIKAYAGKLFGIKVDTEDVSSIYNDDMTPIIPLGIGVVVGSPVEIYITTASGKYVGMINGILRLDVEGAIYQKLENITYIVLPKINETEQFTITVRGLQDGNYTLAVISTDDLGNINMKGLKQFISKGEIHRMNVQISPEGKPIVEKSKPMVETQVIKPPDYSLLFLFAIAVSGIIAIFLLMRRIRKR
jgi:hypothetical protein